MNRAHPSLLAVAAFALALTACGGCPWVDLSTPTASPAATTSCLELRLGGSDGSSPGGCVNPDLYVTNHCSETLTVPATVLEASEAITVGPGGYQLIEISLYKAGSPGNDADTDFAIPATLGTMPIAIHFVASR